MAPAAKKSVNALTEARATSSRAGARAPPVSSEPHVHSDALKDASDRIVRTRAHVSTEARAMIGLARVDAKRAIWESAASIVRDCRKTYI